MAPELCKHQAKINREVLQMREQGWPSAQIQAKVIEAKTRFSQIVYDKEVDVYSFSILLFEMTGAVLPFL